MRIFKKHTTTACAMILAGILAITALPGNTAYADQSTIEYLENQAVQAEQNLRSDNLFEANKEALLGSPDLILTQTDQAVARWRQTP